MSPYDTQVHNKHALQQSLPAQPTTTTANVMHHPEMDSPVDHDPYTNAVPEDFTFTTQTSRRALPSQDFHPPHLFSTKSSPARQSGGHVKASASKMHKSMADLDDIGDTQQMTTQDFLEQSEIGYSRDGFPSRAGVQKTQESVELPGSIEQEEEGDDVSITSQHTNEFSPETISRMIQNTPMFKTPATVSRKRNMRGELISSEVRTSSTRGPASAIRAAFGNNFGGDKDLAMTQLFKTTQGYSSPANAPNSDIPFERPSPNMFLQHSSPSRPSPSDGMPNMRYSTEPVDNYRTMKESQQSRELREREGDGSYMEIEGTSEFDAGLETFERHAIWQQQKSDGISRAILKAPKRTRWPASGRKSRSMENLGDVDQDVQTKAPRGSRPLSPASIPDTQDESMLPADEDAERRSLSPDAGVQVPMTSSKPTAAKRARSSQATPSRSHSAVAAPTQTVAIQDSQKHASSQKEEQENPQPVVISSTRSDQRVIQSQISSSSQEDGIEMKSKPDQALRGQKTEMHDEEELIPSSPPLGPEFSEHDADYNDEIELPDEDEEADRGSAVGDEEQPMVLDTEMPDADDGRHPDGVAVSEDEDIMDEDEVDLVPSAETKALEVPCAAVEGNQPRNVAESLREDRSNSEAQTPTTKKSHNAPASSRVDGDAALSKMQLQSLSNGTAQFETAATHQTPVSSSRTQDASPSQRQSQVSPIKNLADIAAAHSPRRAGESFDLDSIVNDVFTKDDHEFMALMSGSSPVKKRRIYSNRRTILQDPSRNENKLRYEKSDIQLSKEPDTGKDQPSEVAVAQQDEVQDAPRAQTPQVQEPVPGTTSPTEARENEGSKAALRARKLVASRKVAGAPRKAVKAAKRSTPIPRSLKARPSRSMRASTIVESDVDIDDGIPKRSNEVEEEPEARPSLEIDATPAAIVPSIPQEIVGSSSNQILARFQDAKLCYYPATYLSTVFPDSDKYKVRFYDGTIITVDARHVRSFQLKVGDAVKLDMTGMGKGVYIVTGFVDPQPAADGAATDAFTDALGHTMVKVAPRLSGKQSTSTKGDEEATVPVANVYMTGQMFGSFYDRTFTPASKGDDRISTPGIQVSEPSTPGSRHRRHAFSTSIHGAVSDVPIKSESGLFSNMVFTLTFAEDGDTYRENIKRLIARNGGSELAKGLDELFESDSPAVTSPKKRKATADGSDEDKPLRLRKDVASIGFTAVIADRHCRTVKYLQALALGVPCLHHRWLTDCVDRDTILPFEPYLLAAGESDFLFGATRSRIIAPYVPDSAEAALYQVLERRPQPLTGSSVLLVIKTADKRKAIQFLAHAAGAVTVHGVATLGEAKASMEDGKKFDYILFDGDKDKLSADKVHETLLGSEGPQMRKSHKRSKTSRGADVSTGGNVEQAVAKIADIDFLKQCLILGDLADVL